jgi:hypothetical protein
MATSQQKFSGSRHRHRQPICNARVKRKFWRAVEPRIGKTRKIQSAEQRVVLIGNRSAKLHQGQRSDAPHQRAGHMTAPDHLAETQLKILRRRGPSTYDFRNSGNGKPPQSRRRPASVILRRFNLVLRRRPTTAVPSCHKEAATTCLLPGQKRRSPERCACHCRRWGRHLPAPPGGR